MVLTTQWQKCFVHEMLSRLFFDYKLLRNLSILLFQWQLNDDSCLAYTLTVICNLLSQFGMTSTTRFLGSSYAPMTSIDSSLTIHQQLYVLLRRALNRSESLKLSLLVSANRLEMAKFEMMVRI